MKLSWNKKTIMYGIVIFLLFVFVILFALNFRKGMNGTKLVYKISYDTYEQVYSDDIQELANIKSIVEDIIMYKVDKRLHKSGIIDYKLYIQHLNDEPMIVIEVGGFDNVDKAKEIIGKTVELEFKLPNDSIGSEQEKAERAALVQNLYNDLLKNPDKFEAIAGSKQSENIFHIVYDKVPLYELPTIYQENSNVLDETQEGKISPLMEGKYYSYLYQDQSGNIQNIDINGYTFFRMIAKEQGIVTGANLSGDNRAGLDETSATQTLYSLEEVFVQDRLLWKNAQSEDGNIINGVNFKYATVGTSQSGQPVVIISFDNKGKTIFCNITEKNIGKEMSIFIGGEMITSPVIQSKICDGSAQIDGNFTAESAKELANQLNDGALPAPLILMQEEKIKYNLWASSLVKLNNFFTFGYLSNLLEQ